MSWNLQNPNSVVSIEQFGENRFKFITKERRWDEQRGKYTIDGPAVLTLTDLVHLKEGIETIIKRARHEAK